MPAFFIWRKNPFCTNLQAKRINIFLQETFSLSNSGKKTADIAYFQTKTIKKIKKVNLFKEDYTMKRKFLAIAIVLSAMGIWATSALALDPMGPPAAGLKQGGMSLGLDYSYSQIDLKLKNDEETADNKVEKAYANLGYGIADYWNVFGRLGGSKAEGEDLEFWGAYGLAWGMGTKVTIYQDVDITWGALFQLSWGESKERWAEGNAYDKLKWHEYQIAAGPTYRLTDNISIYGGPFYSYLKGTGTDETGKWADIKGKDQTGAYIGGQFDFIENVTLNAEYQLSNGASGIGLMLVWKF
jgi:hypothetical protein